MTRGDAVEEVLQIHRQGVASTKVLKCVQCAILSSFKRIVGSTTISARENLFQFWQKATQPKVVFWMRDVDMPKRSRTLRDFRDSVADRRLLVLIGTGEGHRRARVESIKGCRPHLLHETHSTAGGQLRLQTPVEVDETSTPQCLP